MATVHMSAMLRCTPATRASTSAGRPLPPLMLRARRRRGPRAVSPATMSSRVQSNWKLWAAADEHSSGSSSSSAPSFEQVNHVPDASSEEEGSTAAPSLGLPLSSSSASASLDSLSCTSASSSDEEHEGKTSPDSSVQVDLQLPRRSLLVTFTCNRCEGRTERLVNPIAWEKGMVIAQCATCQAWHKLADAANLVEEIVYADLEG